MADIRTSRHRYLAWNGPFQENTDGVPTRKDFLPLGIIEKTEFIELFKLLQLTSHRESPTELQPFSLFLWRLYQS